MNGMNWSICVSCQSNKQSQDMSSTMPATLKITIVRMFLIISAVSITALLAIFPFL